MSEEFEIYASPIIERLEPLPLDGAKIVRREEIPIGDLDCLTSSPMEQISGIA
jgi:hypothetical protein